MNRPSTPLAKQTGTAQATGVTSRHVCINSLRLKVPHMNARAAQRLAHAVASQLSASGGALPAGRIERIRTRVVAPPTMTEDAMAATIAQRVNRALFAEKES